MIRMKSFVLALVVAAALSAPAAHAVTIGITPDDVTASIGDPVIVDVNVDGLGDFAPDSLGALSLDLTYDDTVLDLVSVAFTNLLGDWFLFESLGETIDAPGSLGLFLVSFLTPGELDALQPAAFTLATVEFQAIGDGPANLGVGNAVLVDGFGEELGTEPVPEPSTYLTFGLGLAGLVGLRRVRRG